MIDRVAPYLTPSAPFVTSLLLIFIGRALPDHALRTLKAELADRRAFMISSAEERVKKALRSGFDQSGFLTASLSAVAAALSTDGPNQSAALLLPIAGLVVWYAGTSSTRGARVRELVLGLLEILYILALWFITVYPIYAAQTRSMK